MATNSKFWREIQKVQNVENWKNGKLEIGGKPKNWRELQIFGGIQKLEGKLQVNKLGTALPTCDNQRTIE